MQMVVGCQDYDFRELEKVRDMEWMPGFNNTLDQPCISCRVGGLA